MSKGNAIKASGAYVELFTEDSKLTRGLRAAETKLKAWGSGITAVGAKVFAAGAAFTTPFIAATKIFSDMGGDLADMSQRTGVSVEALSELGYASDLSGTSIESLEGSLRKMQKNLAESVNGGGISAEIAELGINIDHLKSLAPEDQMTLLGDAISQIQDPAKKASMMMAVFGKSGADLLPLFADGAAGINAMRQEAQDLGLVMSTDNAQAAEAFGDDMDKLWKVLKQTAIEIGISVMPMIKEFVLALTTGAVAVVNWIKENQDMIRIALMVAAGIAAGGAVMIAAGATLSMLGSIAGVAATALTAVGAAIGFLLSPIGLVIAGLAGLATWFFASTEAGAETLDWLGGVFNDLKDDALAAFGAIGDALAGGNIALAAKVLWTLLKLEWQKGLHFINNIWQSAKGFFLEVWTGAVYGLAGMITDAWAGIQVGWLESVNFIKNSWTAITSYLKQKWNEFGGFFGKVWAKMKEQFGGEDASAEIARINKETAAEDARIADEANKTYAEREAARLAKRGQIETERQQVNAELGKMANAELEAIAKSQQQAIDESQAAVDAAKAEFADVVGEAKGSRAAAEQRKRDKPQMKLPTVGDLQSTAAAVENDKSKIAGTFSAAAAGRFGAASKQDDAKAQLKKQDEQIKAIAELGRVLKVFVDKFTWAT